MNTINIKLWKDTANCNDNKFEKEQFICQFFSSNTFLSVSEAFFMRVIQLEIFNKDLKLSGQTNKSWLIIAWSQSATTKSWFNYRSWCILYGWYKKDLWISNYIRLLMGLTNTMHRYRSWLTWVQFYSFYHY